MVTSIPVEETEFDLRIRVAFENVKVRAILGTSFAEAMPIDEAKCLLESLDVDARPVFVLDRGSVDESVLDIDIIDIRVHLILASAAGNVGAREFGVYAESLSRGIDPAWPPFGEARSLGRPAPRGEDLGEGTDAPGTVGSPEVSAQRLQAAATALISHLNR